jgi:hypothetical protein
MPAILSEYLVADFEGPSLAARRRAGLPWVEGGALPRAQCGITVILMRFHFDERKSGRLRANPKRGIGFEEAQEVFSHPYYLDQRSDWPEQYRAIGWVSGHSLESDRAGANTL